MNPGRALRFAGNGLFALSAMVIGGGILALTVLPPMLRYQTYVVLSGSMEPAIRTGSVIVASAVEPQSLRVGDVITFVRSGQPESITHRIVDIKPTPQGPAFTTRGDANGANDPEEIRFDYLAGKVTLTVPYLGYFFKFIGTQEMRLLLIVLPGLLLLATWLWDIWRPEPKPKPPAEELSRAMSPPPSEPRAKPGTVAGKLDIGVASDAATVPLRQ